MSTVESGTAGREILRLERSVLEKGIMKIRNNKKSVIIYRGALNPQILLKINNIGYWIIAKWILSVLLARCSRRCLLRVEMILNKLRKHS